MASISLSRREFLAKSGSCTAHLALAAAVAPDALRAAWARTPIGRVVATEPFGSLEQIGEGLWALISTPLGGDRTTLSNGGLIAGRSGVIAIEGFNQPAGAAWLATKAHELTGRWPTHVVVTHYHADHANGVAGYVPVDGATGKTTVRATERTRDLVLEKNQPADAGRTSVMQQVVVLPSSEPSTIDLGNRRVRIVPRSGHTASDVSIEIEEPSVVFCGDLVWNAMFPNYVDAIPSELSKAARALRHQNTATIYVPGHGATAVGADLDRYLALLDEVEQGARRSRDQGKTAAEGAAAFTLPPALGTWALFGPTFFERAFAAWYRELGAPR